MENVNAIPEFMEKLVNIAALYLPKVLLAVIFLLLGLWLIKFAMKMLTRVMDKRDVDPSLKPFLRTLTAAVFQVLLFVSVASMVGISTASFVAIIAAAGLAIGLALQGSLQNFAGGVLILLLKPFKLGDFIVTSNGLSGTVLEIQIFYTRLKTPQNQHVIIPNGQLSNNAITNYSAEDTRRMDLTFGIGYGDDIDKAKNILSEIVEKDDRILREPEPSIVVDALADSSVNFMLKLWVQNTDYWTLIYDMQEKVKKAFDAGDVKIPFPQRDVHLYQDKVG